MPDEVPEPTSNSLADLFASCAEPLPCPPPPPRPSLLIQIGVPETAWPAGTRIDLTIRPGVIDAVGGGECWFLEGFAHAPDGQRSAEPDPWMAQPPENCEPVPEPTFALGLGLGLILLAVFTRRKRRAQADL